VKSHVALMCVQHVDEKHSNKMHESGHVSDSVFVKKTISSQ